MQTFLPYPSFTRSARVLDRLRLGKQRVEAWQILQALTGASLGWVNHPAVKMWRGFNVALALYGEAICVEWRRRGYRDTMLDRFRHHLAQQLEHPVALPPWFGRRAFHRAHRSNLLRKEPSHYRSRFERNLPDDLPYVWPTLKEKIS